MNCNITEDFRSNLNIAKENLRKVYDRIESLESFRNRDLRNRELLSSIGSFIDSWKNLIYRSNCFSEESFSDRNSYGYQIKSWYECWAEEFNKEISYCIKNDTSFIHSEVFEGLIGITNEFLKASFDEDERKALEYSYGFDEKRAYKARWITEALLNTRSSILPMYIQVDLNDSFSESRYHRWLDRRLYKRKIWGLSEDIGGEFHRVLGLLLKNNLSFKNRVLDLEQECASRLRDATNRILTSSSWMDKTLNGEEFFKILIEFENTWIRMIKNGINLPENREDIQFMLERWLDWTHFFNYELIQDATYSRSFEHPDFLNALIEQTNKFLNAETLDEKIEILKIRYFLERNLRGCQQTLNFVTQIWVDEKILALDDSQESNEVRHILPQYFVNDVTDYVKEPCLQKLISSNIDAYQSNHLEKLKMRRRQKLIDSLLEKNLIVDNFKDKINSSDNELFKVVVDSIDNADVIDYVTAKDLRNFK